MSTQNFKVGDRVSFDADGIGKKPYGFGTVTRVVNGQPMINPDAPVAPNFRMVNIQKVGQK
jgi:hypothetical protein